MARAMTAFVSILALCAATALAARPRFSYEIGGGAVGEFGWAAPRPNTAVFSVSPCFEAGWGLAIGRFRPIIFGRYCGSVTQREVDFSAYHYTATLITREPALGIGLTFQPDLEKRWFVRGDIYPFFPIVADRNGPRLISPFDWVEATPQNSAGVGLRGSVGVLLRPFALSLTGEYDNWASKARASLYENDMGLIRGFDSKDVDFSTRVFRVALTVGLRLGG